MCSPARSPFPFPPDKALGQVQSHDWLSLPIVLSSQDYSGLSEALTHHQEVHLGKIPLPAEPGDPDREDRLIPHLADDASEFKRTSKSQPLLQPGGEGSWALTC